MQEEGTVRALALQVHEPPLLHFGNYPSRKQDGAHEMCRLAQIA